MTTPSLALGFGIGTQNTNGEWLEVFYPQPIWHPKPELVEALAQFWALMPSLNRH